MPSNYAEQWDRRAPGYDEWSAGLERRWLGPNRPWVCRRATGRTLELAVGTGANLVHYPDDVELTGIDFSAAMLDLAATTAERLDRAITLQHADASDLPFPDADFDTVVATFSMCCVPDHRAALEQALRVLRPGGRLLLADHVSASWWPARLAQHALDLITVPWHGESFTRRPLRILHDLGVPIVETERHHLGIIERVYAAKPA